MDELYIIMDDMLYFYAVYTRKELCNSTEIPHKEGIKMKLKYICIGIRSRGCDV